MYYPSQGRGGGGTVVTLPLLCYYARDGILQPEGSTAVRNHSCISSKSKTNVCMSCYSGSEHSILRLCQDLWLATIFFIITSPRVCTPLVAKKPKTKPKQKDLSNKIYTIFRLDSHLAGWPFTPPTPLQPYLDVLF